MEKITIFCAGCGRSQTLRKSKLIKCDYYTCSFDCKINPDFKHKPVEEGYIHRNEMYAAGAFVGHIYKLATSDEQQAILRAKLILKKGLDQLGGI